MKNKLDGYIVALDVGDRRIGVAITHTAARLPKALATLENTPTFFKEFNELLDEEQVVAVVVGVPRDMSHRATDQTATVSEFIEKLKTEIDLPVFTQDEAVTSILAEEQLRHAKKGYNKGMVDAEAAVIILQDFLTQQGAERA